MQKVAVIGAGVAGLSLAKGLEGLADVTIFEKSRGFGGRMPTRYNDLYHFDHGAQFLTMQTDRFRSFLAPYIDQGIIQRWYGRFVALDGCGRVTKELEDFEPYVCAPKMNTLGKVLAEGLAVHRQIRVGGMERIDKQWRVFDDAGNALGMFDWVISTAPSPQTIDILPKDFMHYATIENAMMVGCFTLMLGFETRKDLPWNAAFVNDSPLMMVSVNSTKPGRPDGFSIVINSDNAWAENHMEDALDDVRAHMIGVASDLLGMNMSKADHVDLHRWRYANVAQNAGRDCLFDPELKIAAAGDWCIDGRVEAAFQSAQALLEKMKPVLQ